MNSIVFYTLLLAGCCVAHYEAAELLKRESSKLLELVTEQYLNIAKSNMRVTLQLVTGAAHAEEERANSDELLIPDLQEAAASFAGAAQAPAAGDLVVKRGIRCFRHHGSIVCF